MEHKTNFIEERVNKYKKTSEFLVRFRAVANAQPTIKQN